VKSGKCAGITLRIPDQAAKMSGPGKRAINHPPPRQPDKAFVGFRQLDDNQFDVVGLGRLGGIRAVVVLIDKRHTDVVVGHRLHRPVR
jgi:hypothetical protein